MYRVVPPQSSTSFQSTLSMRRATLRQAFVDDFGLFQSTLSMRRATICFVEVTRYREISIHALHEESDGAA